MNNYAVYKKMSNTRLLHAFTKTVIKKRRIIFDILLPEKMTVAGVCIPKCPHTLNNLYRVFDFSVCVWRRSFRFRWWTSDCAINRSTCAPDKRRWSLQSLICRSFSVRQRKRSCYFLLCQSLLLADSSKKFSTCISSLLGGVLVVKLYPYECHHCLPEPRFEPYVRQILNCHRLLS